MAGLIVPTLLFLGALALFVAGRAGTLELPGAAVGAVLLNVLLSSAYTVMAYVCCVNVSMPVNPSGRHGTLAACD